MKALFLAVGAATLIASPPAAASVYSFGSSFARSCYLAADLRLATIATIGECTAALQVQPLSDNDRLASHVNRGILHMVSRNHAAARADFEKALAINPNHPEAWLNLGILHYNRADSARALGMFERAIELGAQDQALAYFGRGLAHEDRGDVRAAYADLIEAQRLRPDWVLPGRELARYEVRR